MIHWQSSACCLSAHLGYCGFACTQNWKDWERKRLEPFHFLLHIIFGFLKRIRGMLVLGAGPLGRHTSCGCVLLPEFYFWCLVSFTYERELIAIEKFLRSLRERNVSPHTLKAYSGDLENFSACIGARKWREIDHIVIRGFL